jgi:hypothetical protein
VLSERRRVKVQGIEPAALYLLQGQTVTGVDVKAEREALATDPKATSHEPAEKADEVDIGVHQGEAVPFLLALGPIEHASRLVKCVTFPGTESPFQLECPTPIAPSFGDWERSALVLGQAPSIEHTFDNTIHSGYSPQARRQ